MLKFERLEDRRLLDANGNGVHDQTYESFSNGDPLMISGETYVVSTLDVGSEITTISDLNVRLDISTAYNAELAAWLIAPDGTSTLLFSSIGGSGDGFSDVVFDDEAVDPARGISDGTIQGALQPFYALSEFDGLDPNGEWQLKIYDRYVFGSATLNGWSLDIAEEEKLAVTGTDGYFTFDGLPPHDYSLVVDIGPQYEPSPNAANDIVLGENEVWYRELGFTSGGTSRDKNNDGRIGSYELDWLRSHWMDPDTDDFTGDGINDNDDLDWLRSHWGLIEA